MREGGRAAFGVPFWRLVRGRGPPRRHRGHGPRDGGAKYVDRKLGPRWREGNATWRGGGGGGRARAAFTISRGAAAGRGRSRIDFAYGGRAGRGAARGAKTRGGGAGRAAPNPYDRGGEARRPRPA